jgi:hypothetical protein
MLAGIGHGRSLARALIDQEGGGQEFALQVLPVVIFPPTYDLI